MTIGPPPVGTHLSPVYTMQGAQPYEVPSCHAGGVIFSFSRMPVVSVGGTNIDMQYMYIPGFGKPTVTKKQGGGGKTLHVQGIMASARPPYGKMIASDVRGLNNIPQATSAIMKHARKKGSQICARYIIDVREKQLRCLFHRNLPPRHESARTSLAAKNRSDP